MVSVVSPRFTCNARPDGTLRPDDLPPINEAETVRIAFALKPMLEADTVSSVTWSSDPSGLTFANSSVTASDQTVNTDLSGDVGAYTIYATCTLTSGAIRKPYTRIRISGEQATDYQ